MEGRIARRWTARCALLCLVTVAALLQPGFATRADDNDDRRVRMGARQFRFLIAADLALDHKVAADGKLHVQVYARDKRLADDVAELIAPKSDESGAKIQGLDLVVESSAALPSSDKPLAGVFLAQAPDDKSLDQLIGWGIHEHVVVYSPFEGHVERGVLGGFTLEAKVRPYVNMKTLSASGIELKPLFLKIAKTHE